MATCEQNGHIYGHDAACVFCGEDRPKNQPHGPVSERFMRHHYGASRGAEEFASHAAIENARRYVRLPTVDADSKRIISALLAALKGVVRVADRKTAEFDAAACQAGAEALADLQRLREALPTLEQVRQVEFAGLHQGWDQCPACHGYKAAADKHLPDCWIARLAALLETP